MQVPGPSRRQGQRWTHLQHRSGRDWRPQAELRHVPWALGRRQCAWGSQGRPVPATEAYEPPPGPWQKYTCTAHILSVRHLWLAALETEYWARWTLALMEYCCSQGLVFCYVFPRETAQAFLKWTEEKKKSQGNEIDHIKKIYEHLVPEHILLQTEGLIFEPHWCQRCGLLPSCGNPAKLDEHRRF